MGFHSVKVILFKAFVSNEHLKSTDGIEYVHVDSISAVGIQKAIAVGAGFQIEFQCPYTPEKVNMPVKWISQ